MQLKINANDDLLLVETDGTERTVWKSIGGDPAFRFSYRSIRKPFIVFDLASGGEALDPVVYFNRGRGFGEADSVSFSPAMRFVLIVDIGWAGMPGSFRIDPATFPTKFSIRTSSFSNREQAQTYLNALCLDHPEATVFDLGKLPRFTFRFPMIPPRSKPKATLDAYCLASYRLAAAAPFSKRSGTDGVWLSIIVPVYNTPPRYLDELFGSFLRQGACGVELILSDDGSSSDETKYWLKEHAARKDVQVVFSAENRGIAAATNAGLDVATGKWAAFLDHDDVIAPYALKIIREVLDTNDNVKFLYTDEVIVDDALRVKGLMLKPDFDPVLLTGVNYINHFSVYLLDRLRKMGQLRLGYDGSQDYDLLLRYVEDVCEDEILHLPYPAYWWRQTGRTYSSTFLSKATENARSALRDHFARMGRNAVITDAITETLHRARFDAEETTWPKISIIIPSKDCYQLISRILDDLFRKTDYPNFEVIVVDNGSEDKSVLNLYEEYSLTHTNFIYDVTAAEFNFSKSVNIGISKSSGAHFLILNNDIEVIEKDWMKEMVGCLQYENAGIVGAKLLYPDNSIQHAGVIVGFGGLAGHWYSHKPANFGGPMNRLHVRNSVTSVTGAAMLVSGDCVRAIGKWDERNFAVAYNDIDYCLRARAVGFRVIWTPFSCLYHHESVSRGSDAVGERKARFDREKESLRRIHKTSVFRDPTINPAYTNDRSEPALRVPDELFLPRQRNGGH